jgi:hypothetical protein
MREFKQWPERAIRKLDLAPVERADNLKLILGRRETLQEDLFSQARREFGDADG